MAVSLTGTRGLSLASIRYFSIVMGIALGMGFYLYGPSVTPIMQGAALSSCNEMTGGNFRSYEVNWVVGTQPHWDCWDRSAPEAQPVNMGWWVSGR